MKSTNHRKLGFSGITQQYVASYHTDNVLTGLDAPFYAMLFKFKYQRLSNNELKLAPVLGSYEHEDDDNSLAVDVVSLDDSNKFLEGLKDLMVSNFNIFYLILKIYTVYSIL